MPRFARFLPLALLLLPLACSDGDADRSTGPSDETVPFSLALQAALGPLPASGAAGEINRIRVTVFQADDRSVLTVQERDVDPAAPEFSIDVEFEIPADRTIQVELLVELLNVQAGVETVEWSGRLGPFGVSASETTEIQRVSLVRGPPGNLDVVGVTLAPGQATVVEGNTVPLSATVLPGGGSFTLFWSSLDPGIATVDGSGLVTGVAPGTVGVEVLVGSVADTAEITVLPRADRVVVEPDTAFVDTLPAEVQFSAAVLDPRDDPFPDQVVIWSVLTPEVLEHLGGGLFAVLRSGEGRVEATSVAAPELTAEGVVVVEVPDADLEVVKTVDSATPFEGDTVVFTVAVRNLGPDLANDVVVDELLGEGLELVDVTVTRGGYDDAEALWTLGDLAASDADTLRLTARVDSGTVAEALTNTATVRSTAEVDDPDPSNDEATASVVVDQQVADLAVEKTAEVEVAFPGDTVTFTVVVTNLGPDPATGVALVDEPDSELEVVDVELTRGSFDEGLSRWVVGDLDAGASETLTLRAVVSSDAAGGTVVNRALLVDLPPASPAGTPLPTTAQFDPDPSNDVDEVEVAVEDRQIDLGVLKTVDDPEPAEGSEVTFTVLVENNSGFTAEGVEVTELLPVGLSFGSASVSGGSYDPETGVWTVGSLGAESSATLSLTAVVDAGTAGQALVNTAAVSGLGNGLDPNAVNDADEVEIFPVGADLAVTKTADRAEVGEGQLVLFTVTVENVGATTATEIQVLDLLPEGLLPSEWSVEPGEWDPETGLWDVGPLVDGSLGTLEIYAVPESGTAGSTLVNEASLVSSDPSDTNPENDTGEAAVDILGVDLAVFKSVDDATPVAGQVVTFDVSVSNLSVSEGTATGVEVTDLLPAGLTFVSATPSQGSYDETTGIWTVGSVGYESSAVLTLKASVDLGTEGSTLQNEARLTAVDQTDEDGGNDLSRVDVNPRGLDLEVTKSADVTSPFEGDLVTFTVTVSNLDASATATGVEVSDVVPAGLTLQASTPGQGAYDSGTGVWTVGSLGSGTSATLTLQTVVDLGTAGTTLTNTATLSASDQLDDNGANDQGQAAVTVEGVDLAVSKAGIASKREGETVTFPVTVQNLSSKTVTGVEVTDLLPSGVTFQSAVADVGTYDDATGVWTVGSLGPGIIAGLDVTATVDFGIAPTTLSNTATLTAVDQTDINSANDAASISFDVLAMDVAVTKTVDVPSPFEGDFVTFTVTATNQEPLGTVTGLEISDPLPAGLTFSGATPSQGTYDPGTGIWTVGSLGPSASATLTLVAAVDFGTAGSTLTNTATRSAQDQTDDVPGNDAASASVTPQGVDLAVTKTAPYPARLEGEPLDYTVSVQNTSSTDVRGIEITDLLPPELGFTGSTASQGSYDDVTGLWTVGTLAAGATATLTINTTVEFGTAPSTVVNTATLTASDQTDTNPANDSDSWSITVDVVQISVSKTVDNDPDVVEGELVTFRIQALNQRGPATGVELTDILPAGLTFDSFVTGTGTYDPVTGLWNPGTIGGGSLAELLILATVDQGTLGQVITNEAQLTAVDQTDETTVDDIGTVDITVVGVDVGVTKSADDLAPVQGQLVTFTVTVTNQSTSDAATGVEVTDALPAGITYDSDSPTQGTYDSVTGVWTVGTLGPGSSATLTLAATVDAGVAPGTSLVNDAVITAADQGDDNPANDSAAVTLVVQNQTPTADPATATTNDETPVTITLSGSDPEGDALAFSIVSGPTFGSLGPITVLSATTAEVTYTPTLGSLGDATFTYQVDDGNGGTATADVTVTVNDVAQAVSYTIHGNTELVAGGTFPVPGTPHLFEPDGVLANTPTLTVTEIVECGTGILSCTLPSGAVVSMQSDGAFSYIPAVGSEVADAFTYQTDVGGAATASVGFSGEVVWYIDNAVAGPGSGLSTDPFITLADAELIVVAGAGAQVSAAGDVIYVAAGAGTYNELDAFALTTDQRLVGEGVALVVGTDTLAAVGAAPVVSSPNTGVFMAAGSTVEGIDFDGTGSEGITASFTSGTATIRNVTVANAGTSGIFLSNGSTKTITIDSVTISGSTDAGLRLSSESGTVDVTGGSISSSGFGTLGIQVSGGAPSLTYSGSVSSTNAFALVQVDSTTGGSVSLRRGPYTAVADTAARFRHAQGTIRVDSLTIDTGTQIGVEIQTTDTTTSPGTYTFNELDINDATLKAFSVIGGAPTVTANFSATSLNTTSGTAIDVVSTGGAVLTFGGGPIVVNGGVGIDIQSASGGSITFTNDVTMTNPVGTAAINYQSSDAPLDFQGVVDLTVDGGVGATRGVFASTFGTGSMNFASLSVAATNATALDISLGSDFPGTFTGTLPSVTVNGSANGRAVYFNQASGVKSIGLLDITGHAGADAALTGFSAGTIEVTDPTSAVSATDTRAVRLSGTDAAIVLASTNSSSVTGTAGVRVDGGTGTLDLGTGALSHSDISALTGPLELSGGDMSVSYVGTISAAADRVVEIQSRTGGTVDLTGPVLSTGATTLYAANNSGGTYTFGGDVSCSNCVLGGDELQVDLQNNTGATFDFTPTSMNVRWTGGTAFNASGGGTVNVTGSNNRLNADMSAPGIALNVVNTTIGASGLTFRDIWTSGATSGIVLNSTGTAGGLTVTGDGTNLGTGGLIDLSTGPGIDLDATSSVSLALMTVQNGQDVGIDATGVDGLTLDRVQVLSNGSLAFVPGVRISNPTGTHWVTNSVVDGNEAEGILFTGTTGPATLEITGSTIQNNGVEVEDGVAVIANAGAAFTVTATANTFDTNAGSGISALASGGTVDVSIGDGGGSAENSVTGNFRSGVRLRNDGTAGSVLNFDVDRNTLTDNVGAVEIDFLSPADPSAVLEGLVRNNTVPSDQGFFGLGVLDLDLTDGRGIVSLTGNTLGSLATPLVTPSPIVATFGGVTGVQDFDLTVTDNSAFAGDITGIEITQALGGVLCLDLQNNESVSTLADVEIFNDPGTLFEVEGITLGPQTGATTSTELTALQVAGTTVTAVDNGGTFEGVALGTCVKPIAP